MFFYENKALREKIIPLEKKVCELKPNSILSSCAQAWPQTSPDYDQLAEKTRASEVNKHRPTIDHIVHRKTKDRPT